MTHKTTCKTCEILEQKQKSPKNYDHCYPFLLDLIKIQNAFKFILLALSRKLKVTPSEVGFWIGWPAGLDFFLD